MISTPQLTHEMLFKRQSFDLSEQMVTVELQPEDPGCTYANIRLETVNLQLDQVQETLLNARQ